MEQKMLKNTIKVLLYRTEHVMLFTYWGSTFISDHRKLSAKAKRQTCLITCDFSVS